MTTTPCTYCDQHHGPVGDVVCPYTDNFTRLAIGGPAYVRTQQHFKFEAFYNFDWQPPDVVRERNVHDLVRSARQYDNDRLRNLVHNNKKKHYYDITTHTTQNHRHWKRPYGR